MALKKIGLLGGSFNPAHEGHVYISRKARELMGLDEIWWLVSPQNPLKDKYEKSYEERFNAAKDITKSEEYIKISDFEKINKLQYTYDTIEKIKADFPDYKFVWLMGADNIENFHKWHKWEDILAMLPIAIFDRENYWKDAKNTIMMQKYAKFLLEYKDVLGMFDWRLPAIMFLRIEIHGASSTKIRNDAKNT